MEHDPFVLSSWPSLGQRGIILRWGWSTFVIRLLLRFHKVFCIRDFAHYLFAQPVDYTDPALVAIRLFPNFHVWMGASQRGDFIAQDTLTPDPYPMLRAKYDRDHEWEGEKLRLEAIRKLEERAATLYARRLNECYESHRVHAISAA